MSDDMAAMRRWYADNNLPGPPAVCDELCVTGADREAVWRLIYLATISPGLQPYEVADKATDSLMALLSGAES